MTNFLGERPAKDTLLDFLRNGNAGEDMSVNGAITPVDFKYTAPRGQRAVIERFTLELMDAGIKMDKFGARAILDNGVEIGIYDDQDILQNDPTKGHNIIRNGNWSLLAGVDARVYVGAGKDILNVRWTWGRTGAPLRLDPGHYIKFRVQDDLSSIDEFHVMVHGQLFTLRGQ